MVSVVRLSGVGNADVLTLEEFERKELAPHEAWVEQEAIGVNFLDVMQRNGSAPLILPSALGLEGAGRVAAVGAAVTNVAPGDRVAYMLGPIGSYASARAYPAERLIRLPDAISFDVAAAVLFKGITAQYLLKTTFPGKRPSSTVVQVVDRGALRRYRMGSTRAVGGSDDATFHGSSSSTRLAG